MSATWTLGSHIREHAILDIATKSYVDSAVGVENLWNRTGSTLTPYTANDSINIGSGSFTTTGVISCTGLTVTNSFTLSTGRPFILGTTRWDNGSDKIDGSIIANGTVDHGVLAGLGDDDHTQYLLANGTRNLAGNWNLGGYNLTNGGAITGTSFIIGANTLDTNEWAFLDGLDQALKTTDSPTFFGLTLGDKLNAISADFASRVTVSHSAAGAVITQLRLKNDSSTVGTGTRMSFRMLDSNSDDQTYGRIATEIDVNTADSEEGTMRFHVWEGGSATEYLNLNGNTDTVNVLKALTGSSSITGTNFISNIAIGTSPYACTSTTLNTNLNADLWDGYQFADYLNQAVKNTSDVTFNDVTIDGNILGGLDLILTFNNDVIGYNGNVLQFI